VLVVDDEPKIAEVIASYLEKAGYATHSAANGADALRLFEAERPDLVILDLMLPDIPGEEVCRRLRARSRVPIIMVTAKVEDADAIAGLGLGADDYVTKPFSPRQLMARVDAVLRRSGAEALARVLTFAGGELTIDTTAGEVRRTGVVLSLTSREKGILLILASSPGRIFSRDELIDRAMGDDFGGFDRTVDAHVKNLRRKIETDPRHPRFILTVHGSGYRFSRERTP
jgi:DNA-binding response OmpR family regulator